MTAISTARPVPRQAARRRRPRTSPFAMLFLAVLVVYFLTPLWWLVVASSKNVQGLFGGTGGALWFDRNIDWVGNIRGLLTYDDGIYFQWIGNSAFYAIAGGLGATAVAVLAGYGFAKFEFPGRNLTFALLLGSVMVPLTALVIPTFILFSNMGLTDTVWAVILPSFLSPFGVYLMRVYIADAVPSELMQAARVDGASEVRVFFSVALPLMRPAIVTVLLLSVVANWNNYFLPLAMLNNSSLYPVTVGIGLWQSLASSNNGGGTSLWNLIIAGALVSVIPLIAAFLGLQRYWQGGLSLGSLK